MMTFCSDCCMDHGNPKVPQECREALWKHIHSVGDELRTLTLDNKQINAEKDRVVALNGELQAELIEIRAHPVQKRVRDIGVKLDIELKKNAFVKARLSRITKERDVFDIDLELSKEAAASYLEAHVESKEELRSVQAAHIALKHDHDGLWAVANEFKDMYLKERDLYVGLLGERLKEINAAKDLKESTTDE